MKKFLHILILIAKIAQTIATAQVSCPNGDCSFPTITPVTMENEEVIFTGQPSNYIDSTTEYLQFNIDSVLNYIPTDLFKYFSNFRGFIAYNTSTTNIVTNAFNHCPNLLVVYIYNSPFTTLPAGFAQSCSNIFYIDFQYNLLATVDRDAFIGLTNLQVLYLSNNRITCIPPGLFLPTANIQIINLNFNPLELIDSRVFENLLKITEIHLASCQLAILPNFNIYCSGMDNPVTIELNDNPFVAADPNFLTSAFVDRFFTESSSLTFTFLNTLGPITACMPGISISSSTYQTDGGSFSQCFDNWNAVDAGSLQSTCSPPPGPSPILPVCLKPTTESTTTTELTTTTTTEEITTTVSMTTTTSQSVLCSSNKVARFYLDYLDRYTCVLKNIDSTIASISGEHYLTYTDLHVQRLYIVQSTLRRIPNIIFTQFPNMEFLYIRDSSLGVINDQTFNECGNLKFLDASYNNIIHVSENSLRNCTKLKKIDLTGNPVMYVSNNLYIVDPSLETIFFNRVKDFVLN